MKKRELREFTILQSIKTPNAFRVLIKLLIILISLIILMLAITPWQQNSKGYGYVTTIDPSSLPQDITANVDGVINKWFVQDMTHVKKGDKLVEIVDNDPMILERLTREKNAIKRKYEVAEIAASTALLNYERQQNLNKEGLSAKKDLEQAKITYKKLLSEKESAAAEFANIETKLARQQTQIIRAPKDGFILQVLAGNTSTLVKQGDKIARFSPDLIKPVIELYVSSNDIGLIYPGRKVRIQFEGLPAIQFSGWPSLSVGTFGGIVKSVDQFVTRSGKFRVIVEKDPSEEWPDKKFLRHGLKVYGWILLNEVKLGYELWRKINNFPPDFDPIINNKNDIENR